MHTTDNSNLQLPNRLCEDWRFGAPHKHAATLAQMMQEGACRGSITVEARTTHSPSGRHAVSAASGRTPCWRCAKPRRVCACA